jgi:DNA repair exonuclease SbcCD nuclease subunit
LEFRFAHIADTHLGHNWPPILAKDKYQAQVYSQSFKNCLDIAIDHNVDFILHAGDIVHKPQPDVFALRTLFSELSRLESLKIPLVVTRGTHDSSKSYVDRYGGDILSFLDDEGKLVYVEANTSKRTYFEIKKNSLKTRIYGLGDYGPNQVDELQKYSAFFAKDDFFNILLMHGGIADVQYPTGSSLKIKQLNRFERKIDYFALGHNHERFEFPEQSIYSPGSTEYCSFKEASTIKYLFHDSELIEIPSEMKTKGFYIVDVSGSDLNAQFIEIPCRKVLNVEVEFDKATPEEVLRGMIAALQNHEDEDQIIRPVITGTLAKGYRTFDIRTSEIHKSARGLFIDWPSCTISMKSINKWETAFEEDYRKVFEAYYSNAGWKEDSVKRLSDIAINIVQAFATKSLTKSDLIKKVVAIIEKSDVEGLERLDTTN